MNKNDYLDLAGYSAKEWIVAEPLEVEMANTAPDSDSNIYPINHRKFVSELGKGYALINKQWFEEKFPKETKNKEEIPKHTMAEAVKIIDEEFPSSVPAPPTKKESKTPPPPPTVSGMNIPSPPPPKEKYKDITEAVIVEEFYCEEEQQSGVCNCKEQCENCKNSIEDKETVSTDETIQEIGIVEEDIKHHLEEVVEQSNVPKDNVVIGSVASKPKPLTKCTDEELQERVKQVESELGMELIAGMFDHKNPKINLKWPLNHIETLSSDEFDKAIANNLTEINIRLSKIEVEEIKVVDATVVKVNTTKKQTEKLEKVIKLKETEKELKEKVLKIDTPAKIEFKKKIIPEASEKTVQDFAIVDSVIDTLTKFKRTTYALAKIEEIILTEEKDADKIALILNAVQSI